ncbi:MAG: DUF3387 domain-containing protein [Anaerolineaceae bacterium]|nr:DUF3387 domain-containing protein [Anaerolineaceae bacterium]
MTDGLKDKHRKAVIDILSANERVERVILFGSRAMGTFTPTSDVDIVLYGTELTPTDRSKLAAAIDELTMPQQVDLLLHKSIKKKELLEHIEKHGVEWWRRSWDMGGDWLTTGFGDLYSESSRNGLTKPKKMRGSGVKFINMGEIFAHDRLLNAEADLAPLNKKELETSLLKPGDLLFARQSLVLSGAGKCSIFLGDNDPVSFESHLIRVRLDRRKAIPEYYYYFFRSPKGKAAIYSIVEQGAGASGIRGSDLSRVEVIKPPLLEQRAIAHILGSLDEVGFFQEVRAGLSDDFLQEVRQLPHRNLAVELLRKLLNDQIRSNSRKNVVQARSFAEMLEKAIRKYQNRAIEAAQVIEELIKLAREMREARQRGEKLGMTDDEIVFYDALEVNDSAVKILGDQTLKTIAYELVEAVRRSVTIAWTVRENARAQIRVIVKRILRKYGYPPDKQEKATQTVLEQAEVLCKEWTGV